MLRGCLAPRCAEHPGGQGACRSAWRGGLPACLLALIVCLLATDLAKQTGSSLPRTLRHPSSPLAPPLHPPPTPQPPPHPLAGRPGRQSRGRAGAVRRAEGGAAGLGRRPHRCVPGSHVCLLWQVRAAAWAGGMGARRRAAAQGTVRCAGRCAMHESHSDPCAGAGAAQRLLAPAPAAAPQGIL